MTKTKGLILLIIVLLVSNLVAWFMLFNGKKNRSNRKAQTREFLQREMGFSSKQLASFDSLSDAFRQSLKMEMEKTREKKAEVMKAVAAHHFSDSAIQQGSVHMAEAQQNLEMLMLKQAVKIRMLCTAEQLPAFDAGWEKLFLKKPGGRKR